MMATLASFKKVTVQVAVLLTLLILHSNLFSQSALLLPSNPAIDITDSAAIHFERLKKLYGNNKEITPLYEKQIIYALSYFPELANTKIKFKIKNSTKGIISTRPTIGGIFRRSSKRKYLVLIFQPSGPNTIPLFSEAGINGQVGILGHELCHILYFNNKTGLGLIGLGINHVSVKYMDRFERRTDSVDITRGLGYQLMAWKSYLDKGFSAMRGNDEPVREEFPGGKRYMSVAAIEEQIKNTNIYK
jgi:hypothetical protein